MKPEQTLYNPSRDLNELEELLHGFDKYLYDFKGIYQSSYPVARSLGTILLRMNLLDNYRQNLSQVQEQKLENLIESYNCTKKEWAVHFKAKLEKEIASREKLLETNLAENQECGGQPCQADYNLATVISYLKAELQTL